MTRTSNQDPLLEIDPVIHAPARLRLVRQLYVVDAADATFLVNATGLTWGNLATHLRKLEDHGYVAVKKGYRGRKPSTTISLTESGRTAFDKYRTAIRNAVDHLPGS
jgi:DNA-binding MarR family transcriptional regulator